MTSLPFSLILFQDGEEDATIFPPPHLSLPLFGELLPHSRSPKKKNIYNGNVTTSYLTGVTQKLPKKSRCNKLQENYRPL